MLATGAVIVELVATARLEPASTGAALGCAYGIIGLLLGVLATERQWLWSILGSALAVVPQFLTGRIRFPMPEGEEFRILVLLVVPPIALLLGALVGSRVLSRQYQSQIKPEHDD